jgi:predicted nucleic acid-binding protein
MTGPILIDTGPLVASINRGDRFHGWARDRLGETAPPLLTCEAVLAEACFLLASTSGGRAAVMGLIERGILQVDFRVATQATSLAALMAKYADVPMSLADACLVRMTELHENSVLLTLDRDFMIYRRHGRRVIAVLIPPELTSARR